MLVLLLLRSLWQHWSYQQQWWQGGEHGMPACQTRADRAQLLATKSHHALPLVQRHVCRQSITLPLQLVKLVIQCGSRHAQTSRQQPSQGGS